MGTSELIELEVDVSDDSEEEDSAAEIAEIG